MSDRPAAGLLFGRASEGASKGRESGKADPRKEARRAASAAAMKAFHAKDEDALDAALGAHYDACAMTEPTDD